MVDVLLASPTLSLPEPYASWWTAVLGVPPPVERTAKCEDCIMCREGLYARDLKCCGYVPAIPNFRVGGALRAGGEPARAVTQRLETVGIRDGYLGPTDEESHAYEGSRMAPGVPSTVRCPYVTDDARCAIWAFRNATCATWFCRHDGGEAGAALWDAAADLFRFAEQGVTVLTADDDLERCAERADAIAWEDLREAGGDELSRREDVLRQCWASLVG